MSARKVVIGCSTAAIVTLAFLVIGGIVAFKRLTAPAPLPAAARLVDSQSLGLAVVRLDPDDPWVEATIAQLSKYSTREQRPKEMFPLELVWTERRAPDGHEQHLLSLSLSHGGRFLGLVGDLMLWRAGRGEHAKVARVEYGGEGITSFPGTQIQGNLFIRDNSFIWSSDLDTAKKAVDLLTDVPKTGGAEPAPAGEPARVFSLVPKGEGHTLSGAILNENGSLARSLSLVPGESLDIPPEMLAAVEYLTFTLDTTSEKAGTGEIILAFVPGTPAETIAGVARELCARMAAVSLAKVSMEATPRLEESRAVLAVKVGGLDSVSAPLLDMFTRSVKHVESFNSGGHPGEAEPPGDAKDPNQSSSTFQ